MERPKFQLFFIDVQSDHNENNNFHNIFFPLLLCSYKNIGQYDFHLSVSSLKGINMLIFAEMKALFVLLRIIKFSFLFFFSFKKV